MNSSEIIIKFKQILIKIIEEYKKELMVLRTGRPTPALVEDIPVIYYEQKLTIKQLGSINIVPPREIEIHIWDKEAINNVLKALENAGYNFSVKSEGNLVKVFLPELSEERKKELIKKAKEISEKHRIMIRHARDEINKEIQEKFENKEINEDLKFKLKEEVQKEVEKVNEEIEKLLERKIQEIKE